MWDRDQIGNISPRASGFTSCKRRVGGGEGEMGGGSSQVSLRCPSFMLVILRRPEVRSLNMRRQIFFRNLSTQTVSQLDGRSVGRSVGQQLRVRHPVVITVLEGYVWIHFLSSFFIIEKIENRLNECLGLKVSDLWHQENYLMFHQQIKFNKSRLTI